MSERSQPKLLVEGSAAMRSAEEQQRLIDEYDTAIYESGEDEAAFEAAMAAREHDKNVQIEGRIMQDVSTRRMYMMAQNIAELRANGASQELVSGKEDKLQELLLEFSDAANDTREYENRNAQQERSTPKGDAIRMEKQLAAETAHAERMEEIDFILKSTETVESPELDETVAPSESDPASTDESVATESESTESVDADTIEAESTDAQAEADPEQATEAAAEVEPAKSIDEEIEEAKQRLNARADARAQEVTDRIKNSDEAIADREELEKGMRLEEAGEASSRDEAGMRLEDDTAAADAEKAVDDDAEDDAPRKKPSWFTPTGFAANVSAGNYARTQRNAEKEDSKEGKRRKRLLLVGAAALATAGVVYAAHKFGFDFTPGGNGGGNGAGDAAREAATTKAGGNGVGAHAQELFGNGRVEVRDGDGFTQVLDRVLDSHDIHLNPKELMNLHEHLEETKAGYIDLKGAKDVYEMADGTSGLGRTDSAARIAESTQKEVVRWLQERGKLS